MTSEETNRVETSLSACLPAARKIPLGNSGPPTTLYEIGYMGCFASDLHMFKRERHWEGVITRFRRSRIITLGGGGGGGGGSGYDGTMSRACAILSVLDLSCA